MSESGRLVGLPSEWTRSDGAISRHIEDERRRRLRAYEIQPNDVREHVGIEDEVLSGGYGHRQLHELIQNGADALLRAGSAGRVAVVLTAEALYCANEGAPIEVDGVTAILHSHISTKRGNQIGQFGIGFKSVLAVSETPEVFSRSGSFSFEASWSAGQIRTVCPEADRTPVLRLARSADAASAAAQDHVLAELMQWATTVVRLRLAGKSAVWLDRDIETFPREFVLFAPHVSRLTLERRTDGLAREIHAEDVAGSRRLVEGDESSEWRLFERTILVADLPPDALADADNKTKKRETLPLLWAVPVEGRRGRGSFWAFFPTETETSLTGILNAPWKTNADRQNLLGGSFNEALLDAASSLVADSVGTLHRSDEPGAVLDLLPARLQDAKNHADRRLAESLTAILKTQPCVPDVDGVLRIPSELKVRPDEYAELAKRDIPVTGEPPIWVHSSVETRERRPRALALGASAGQLGPWLESLASHQNAAGSKRAILVVRALRPLLPAARLGDLTSCRVVLTASQALLPVSTPGLFLGESGDREGQGFCVHPHLVDDVDVYDTLVELGVPEGETSGTIRRLLQKQPIDWVQIWEASRGLPLAESVDLLARRGVNAMCEDGTFRPLWDCLLPGAVVPGRSASDASVTIDLRFHQSDRELLEACGAVSAPQHGRDLKIEAWWTTYERHMNARYFREVMGKDYSSAGLWLWSRGQAISFGPLAPLARLSGESNARMTELVLQVAAEEPLWYVRRSSGNHPTLDVAGPIKWFTATKGTARTSVGIQPIVDCVAPVLSDLSRYLAVPVDPRVEQIAGLPSALTDVPERLRAAAFVRSTEDEADLLVGAFYSRVCEHWPAPPLIRARLDGRLAMVAPGEAVVIVSPAEPPASLPCVMVASDDECRRLIESWSLSSTSREVRFTPTGASVLLGDLYPGLRRTPAVTFLEHECTECTSIVVFPYGANASAPEYPTCVVDEGQVLFLEGLGPYQRLNEILNGLGIALPGSELERVLKHDENEFGSALVAQVKAEKSLEGKLLLLVGAKRLSARMPPGVSAQLGVGSVGADATSVAMMALAAHGVDVLRVHAEDLAERDLVPPSVWRGSARALEFVDSLGFPPEYAGFPSVNRQPAEEVDGPVVLKPLHDFQVEIAERILGFVGETPGARGLVSLPTGAGKTRVVVEALVEAIREERFRSKVIVWIAQSDELCEQGVQAWRQVWRAKGNDQRIRISRLWGSTNNRVVAAPGRWHVVVATYQTLASRLDGPAYAWLRDAACVVIDEAHGAIASSYTWVLSQFGLTQYVTARPLIGITATPFRGSWAEEETDRLVKRFGARRFDINAIPGDDPYPELQRRGILAQVDHRLLEGGSIELAPEELAHLGQYKELPASAEARLGADQPRNERIVESIVGLDQGWPVLVFATSVDHAELLAALLQFRGVSARAISGKTETGARRHYIEGFKAGTVRVLTNYGVLTTGFDAPAVRALYVARPVFSPVLYQQMIGRGLRGPLNGGKERCLFVTVADNVLQYGERLAFRHFEHLWQGAAIR